MAYRMQSQDCWYWIPVAVAVTPWIVSDSRWTVAEKSEVKHKLAEINLKSSSILTVVCFSYTVLNSFCVWPLIAPAMHVIPPL